MTTPLNQKIYAVISRIPCGKVASYGQIAFLADRPGAARAVGFALRHIPNEEDLPCHRVVFQDGSICDGSIFGGPGVQAQMLQREGITFSKNGKINMEIYRWNGNYE